MDGREQGLIVRCLRCSQKNRIRRDHLAERPFCGRCGASLDELFIQCLSCQRLNRIPEGRLHDLPLCGKCGARLYDDYVREVTDEDFEREVLEKNETVLVCCWTPECELCRRAMPALRKLAPKYLGALKLLQLNIADNPHAVARYSLQHMPAYLLFRNGALAETISGIASLEDLERKLRALS